MANAIEVKNLCKDYEKFSLKNVSFTVPQGSIMGFIGKNGAGKTTTIKSLLNMVHRTSGEILINGMNLEEDETKIKQNIGFSLGTDFYPLTKVKTLTKVYKNFYKDWDDEKYKKLIAQFEIDEKKKLKELSSGMKVKYSLALALSHKAKVLILDEPTTGLDPASRDEIVQIFQDFVQDGKHSILFSTHITSDLEKCADSITYISDGEIVKSEDLSTFTNSWQMVEGDETSLTEEIKANLIGLRSHKEKFDALCKKDSVTEKEGIKITKPSLEDIIVHLERKI